MTISSTTNRVTYTGNSVTTAFTVPYPFFTNADLKVYVGTTLQTITTQYAVTGAGNPAGGTVTFVSPPGSGSTVIILRDPALTQLTDYIENDDFPAASHEAALDKLTAITQRLDERVDRSFVLPDTYTGSVSTTMPTPAASQFLSWDATGATLTNVDPSTLLTIATSSGFVSQLFSGDGAQTAFVLSSAPGSASNLEAFVGGSRMKPGIDYTVSGSTVTFAVAPALGTDNVLFRFTQILPAGTVADLSITTAKLAADAVTTAKIADDAVTTLKIDDDAVTTPKILDGAITTAKWAATNGQIAGMRNKIINGSMEFSQRGTTFAAITTGTYALDRWVIGQDHNGAGTVTQNTDVPSNNEFQYSYRYAVTTADTSIASAQFLLIEQKIEGFDARDLIGRTFTLSFWVRSSKTGTHCIALRNSGSDRSYIAEYTISVANTWEFKQITVSGGLITAGTWDWINGVGVRVEWTLAAGTSFHTTASAWQTGNYIATANQVNCLDTIGNIFAITGVQLELGSVATPFEHRAHAAELALCQRYYEAGTATSFYFPSTSATTMYIPHSYRTTKRAVPSSVDIGTGTNLGFNNAGGSISPSSWTVISSDANEFSVGIGAVSLGGHAAFTFRANAEL